MPYDEEARIDFKNAAMEDLERNQRGIEKVAQKIAHTAQRGEDGEKV